MEYGQKFGRLYFWKWCFLTITWSLYYIFFSVHGDQRGKFFMDWKHV